MIIQDLINTGGILYDISIKTYYNEYNKYEWNQKKDDIEGWFKENIEPFFIRRFTYEDDLYYFFKMYRFETIEGGVIFHVGIFTTEIEIEGLSKEILADNNAESVSFSIYDPDLVEVMEEEVPEELMALVD